MLRFAILCVIALLTGCKAESKGENSVAELEAIAKLCGVPPNQLRLIDGSVRWAAPESTSFTQANCIFEAFEARGFPVKQGHISNARQR